MKCCNFLTDFVQLPYEMIKSTLPIYISLNKNKNDPSTDLAVYNIIYYKNKYSLLLKVEYVLHAVIFRAACHAGPLLLLHDK